MELPGGPVDGEGRSVDDPLLAALTGAAVGGCGECVQRLLEEVAAEPACVARLVEVARLTAIRTNRGELPPYMTVDDDPSGSAVPEFTRLVRAVTAAEPVTVVCEQMTGAERRAAADAALKMLVAQLTVANSLGFDDSETLAEMCCAVAALLVEWWFSKAPMARREFTEAWKKHAFGHREAGLPGDGTNALALLLGALLHHQARQDQVVVEDLRPLVFTRVLPTLKSPERAGAVLAAFVAPPHTDTVTVPIKRYARGNPEFLAELCRYLRSAIAVHVKDCPHGLRESGHACTLAHRGPALGQDAGPQVAEPTPEEGRRVALPWIGFREDEPAEDAPAGHDPHRVWQINVDRIVLERWDAGAARWNEAISEDSSISEPNYRHEVGLEPLCCPSCGSHGPFLAEGSWGDPLTLHCRCGVTTMSPLDAGPDDLGRRLLKRLILCEADPAYAARRLLAPLAEYQEHERKNRESSWYRGPDEEAVTIAGTVDQDSGDLVAALTDAFKPRLPKRHEGGALTLLLLQSLEALSAPAVRDSPDGRRLAEAVRDLLSDLKEESDRWAPIREPVVDRLRTWQSEGGPQLWQDAWTRTLEMAQRYFAGSRVGDGRISDGCAAVALVQYLLAREADCGVEGITADDVRSVAMPGVKQEADPDPVPVMLRFAERLTALGHDLDADDDPVARLWRHLATDRPVSTFGDQRAPALTIGLDTLLGERSFYRVRL
ncbi:MAG TPA: hypothetical protein VN520_04620 [Streptomyces sp.]|uniref:hypothetical protein n=1 Tax=Streptomyces sp. TaxID=1931 RepID=UPI002C6045D8|nr:hypothetical protein [Streptomyces sp.]HWU05673.1 hypothetical protein [Streptomyces sp.]